MRASWGELRERELLIVRLDLPRRALGRGRGGAAGALRRRVAGLGARRAGRLRARCWPTLEPTADVLAACAAERDLPQALAAIDLALWDHASRRTGTPLARLIDPRAVGSVPVNATIGAEDRAGAAAAAAAAARAGFRCVKVKVGIGDDAGRLAAVRAAVGPDVGIRIDANGAWGTAEEALAHLRALEPVGLELCEEPVHGVDALRAVRAGTQMPIAMDETHAPGAGAADAVCLKITRGGITGVLTRRARGAGRRRGRLPRLDVRRPAAGSPPPCTPPPRCGSRAPAGWRRSSPARRADPARRRHRRTADRRACITLRCR